MRLGDHASVEIDIISSGSIKVDEALGIGGYPRGRTVEIYDPESSGKTMLALHATAEVQKEGGRTAFTNVENAIDLTYARDLGVSIDDLIFSQPDSGGQALDITEMLIKSGTIDLAVVDSVAALVPQAELDDETGDANVSSQVRTVSKTMRKLSDIMDRSEYVVIFTNQLRKKVGIMSGSPETTPRGRVLKFYFPVRLDIRHSEAIKNGTGITGNKVDIKVVKNKAAPPFKVTQIEIMYGKGISHMAELLGLRVDHDTVMKNGAWLSYNDEEAGQGKEAAKTSVKSNPALTEELGAKL